MFVLTSNSGFHISVSTSSSIPQCVPDHFRQIKCFLNVIDEICCHDLIITCLFGIAQVVHVVTQWLFNLCELPVVTLVIIVLVSLVLVSNIGLFPELCIYFAFLCITFHLHYICISFTFRISPRIDIFAIHFINISKCQINVK